MPIQLSLKKIRTKCSKAISIVQKDGFLSFVRAGLRELNLNYRGFCYYLNYLYKRFHPSYQTSEPFTVIHVDPQRILRRAPRDIDRWRNIGEVRDGDWDRSNRTLEDGVKYRSVIDRFENGTPWEDTEIYREALERIGNGDSHWNGCRSVDDLTQRVEHIEKLHEEIKTSGFKSQSALRGASVKSILLSGSFDRSKTDVAVAIGRDGEFLFIDGNHRLAIAHVLGLERIPVRIVVRHTMWQEIHEEIQRTDSPQMLSEKTRSHLDHPDVQESISAGSRD